MSRLKEKYVQEKALKLLEGYYQEKYKIPVPFSAQEVRTTKKKGDKRADGLLCFQSRLQENHTVSLEAKSHKTLNALLPYWNDEKLGLHVFIVLFMAGVLTVYLTFDFSWYWIIALFITSIVVITFLSFGIVTILEPPGYKTLNVIKQVKQYPANEQWIAISVDSLNLVEKKEAIFQLKTNKETLIAQCKRNGIGLILITNRTERIEIHPKYKKGRYLNCYSRENSIKTFFEAPLA